MQSENQQLSGIGDCFVVAQSASYVEKSRVSTRTLLTVATMAALTICPTAKATQLDAGPSVYNVNGPGGADFVGSGGFGGYRLSISPWPSDYGNVHPYDKPGRLYLGFSQPFALSSGINFAIEKNTPSGGGLGSSAEFFFYYNYTLVGSFQDNNMSANGVYSYSLSLGEAVANNIVVVNTSARIPSSSYSIGNSPHMAFTDAGVANLVVGPSAPSFDFNHPHHIDYNAIPEPSALALIGFGGGAIWLTRRRRLKRTRRVFLLAMAAGLATSPNPALAAPTVQQGFVITYGAGYDPADFPNGNIAIYNQSFIDNYVSLSATFGGDPLYQVPPGENVVRILAFWDNFPNTVLNPAYQFGFDIVPQEFVDGRFGGVTAHVSEDWLNAIGSDPSLQAQYGFEFKTQEWVNANAVPEPSTYALLLMTGAGALWWARRRH